MMKYVILLSLSILLSGSFQATWKAQSTQKESNQETIKLSSTLVQVPVIVSDKGGRYVTDLKAKDFHLFEDGVEQEIAFFGSIEEPFHVAIVLDSSGSTAEQLELIKRSAEAFIDSLKANDQAMIISFNDSVQIQCEMTANRDQLKRGIRAIRPGEYTQVYEAVYTAVWEKLNRIEGRKAVILFTDGIDTASSELEEEDTLDAVIESEDILVYPIRYNTRPDVEKRIGRNGTYTMEQVQEKKKELNQVYEDADQYLQQLAALSGGTLQRADDLGDLGKAFAHIADELRQQYLLGYYPSNSAKLLESDNERRLKITVPGRAVKIRVRPSYILK